MPDYKELIKIPSVCDKNIVTAISNPEFVKEGNKKYEAKDVIVFVDGKEIGVSPNKVVFVDEVRNCPHFTNSSINESIQEESEEGFEEGDVCNRFDIFTLEPCQGEMEYEEYVRPGGGMSAKLFCDECGFEEKFSS